jgi:hypothetical protein
VQRQTLREFAQIHDWRFLDLTEPLRQAVQAQKVWLYGKYDKLHWSPQGTAVVAPILAAELSNIIGPAAAAGAPHSPQRTVVVPATRQ